MMFVVQFSCCVAYLYFISEQLDNILCSKADICKGKSMYIYILLIPTIPISLIKTYTYLSYVSMVGIAGATLGGLLMMGYCGHKLNTGDYVQEPVVYFDVKQTFGFIGIAMFAFEGNGVVINLKAAAKNKK